MFKYCSNLPVWPLGSHYIWSLLAAIHMKIWQNVQLSQVGLGSTIARIHLCTVSLGSHIWSLLAPILMKSWPKSKLYQVEVSSNICSKSLFPIHMKSWPKSKLYQVEVSSNICSKSLLFQKSCLVIGTIW